MDYKPFIDYKVNDIHQKNQELRFIDLLKDAVILFEHSGKIKDVNNAAEMLFGFSKQEFLKLNYKDLLPYNDDCNSVIEEFENSGIMEGHYIQKCYQTRKKNIILTESSIKIIKQDNPADYIVIIRDQSHIQSYKRQIADLKERLKRLKTDQQKYLSIIAHDLKGFLSSIVGFADITVSGIIPSGSEKHEKYIRIIRHTTIKALELSDNLLNWVRTRSGFIKVIPETFFLSEVFNKAKSSYQTQIEDKELRFVYENDFSEYRVKADLFMTEIILRNLLSNALKYSPHGKEINIDIHKFDKDVIFSITNQGECITHEDKNTVFELSKTFSGSRKTGVQGNGIGLSVCKEFVELNHGKIWYKNHKEQDQGVTFFFTLPSASE